jgi:hypothetical protein
MKMFAGLMSPVNDARHVRGVQRIGDLSAQVDYRIQAK